ncbi:hypothetical protein [Nostoc sp.]|uniref:hypothetical protein n=1 Tax=Nostoc sp. TaxID=1180 RepID=UPI002FF9DEF0
MLHPVAMRSPEKGFPLYDRRSLLLEFGKKNQLIYSQSLDAIAYISHFATSKPVCPKFAQPAAVDNRSI